MDTEGAKLDNEVSIPLGTINTLKTYDSDIFNNVSIPLGTINTQTNFIHWTNKFFVSIPLGTINTKKSRIKNININCFNSTRYN